MVNDRPMDFIAKIELDVKKGQEKLQKFLKSRELCARMQADNEIKTKHLVKKFEERSLRTDKSIKDIRKH